MNDNKRVLNLISLGLLLAALLMPFVIAALGRADLALGFGVTAGALALILAVLGGNEQLRRMATHASLLLLFLGGPAAFVVIPIWKHHIIARMEAQAQRERMQAEQQRVQAAEANRNHDAEGK